MKKPLTDIRRIGSAEELREIITDHALISMDMEGSEENPFEIGLSIAPGSLPQHRDTYAAFIEDNNIDCSTIRLGTRWNPEKYDEWLRFGHEADDIDTNPQSTILSQSKELPKPLLLVLFDATTELKWLSDHYPELSRRFSAYVDVQQLVAQVADSPKSPALRECLKALDLCEGVRFNKDNGRGRNLKHRAVNDTVYTLAILCSLLSRPEDAPPLVVKKSPARPSNIFTDRPPPGHYPFQASIRVHDDSILPHELQEAKKVYRYFSKFNPVAAGPGLRPSRWQDPSNRKQCYLAFASKDDLDVFINSRHVYQETGSLGSSTVSVLPAEVKLVAESMYIPGVTLTHAENIEKMRAEGVRVREDRRRAKLKLRSIERGLSEHVKSCVALNGLDLKRFD